MARCLWLFVLVAAVSFLAHAEISIISQVDQQVVINGVPHQRHYAQIQATEIGTQTYTVQGDKLYTVLITADKPLYTYTVELLGYIPRAVFCKKDESCLLLQEADQSAILAEQNSILGKDANGVPTGNIYKPSLVQSSSQKAVLQDMSASSLTEPQKKLLEHQLLTMEYEELRFLASKMNSHPRELRNLGFSMRVGHLNPMQRKLQQFAAGFLGGLAGSFVFNLLDLGGNGDDGVDAALQAITKQLEYQQTFNQQTVAFEADSTRAQQYTFGALAAMQAQFTAQQRFNTYVNDSLNTQILVDQMLSSALTAGLTSVNTQLTTVTTSELKILWYLGNQSVALNNQFNAMTAGTQQVSKDVTQLAALAFRWYQQMDMRRFLTRALTVNSFNQETDNIPTKPFTSGLGTPPLAASSRARAKNICNSPRIATVNLNYQIGSTAHQTTYEMICDQDWLLDNVSPEVDFKTLFYSLGSTGCYHTDDGSGCTSAQYNYAWNCSCIILRSEYSCAMATPSTIWPFDYTAVDADTLLTYQADAQTAGAPSVCSSGYTPTGATTGSPQSQTPLSNSALFTSNLNSLCTTIKTATGSGGFKVDVTSNYFVRRLKLIMGSSETCSYTSNLFISGNVAASNFGFTIMRLWQFSYQIIVATVIPTLDRTWNGVVPTGVSAVLSPLARVSDSDHVVTPSQCTQSVYGRVWAEENPTDAHRNKLPVYVLRPLTVAHQINVTVTPDGGDPVTPVPVGGSVSQNAANFTDNSGTVHWTTDVSLTTDFSNYLPGGNPMFIAGGLGIPGLRDSINPLLVHDIPDFKWGSPGDCKKVNFIYESASWPGVTSTSELTVDSWMANFAQFFDAGCIEASPHLFMREIDPDTGACNRFFNPEYPPDPAPQSRYIVDGLNYRLCNLMERFDLSFQAGVDGAPDILSFSPHQFIMTADLQFPAGQIIKQEYTACPAVNITVDSGLAIITLTTASTNTITVHVEVTSVSTGPDCALSESVSLSSVSPKQLFIPACGLQYFNVREIGNASWCFLVPMSLNVSQQTGGDSNIGLVTKSQFNVALDGSLAALHDINVGIARAYWLIDQVPRLGVQNVQAALNDIISNIETSLQQNANLVQFLNQTNSSLAASIAQLKVDAAGASTSLTQEAAAAAATQIFVNLVNQSTSGLPGDVLASNFTVSVMGRQLQVVISAVNNVHDKDCSAKPFFQHIICSLENEFLSFFINVLWVALFILGIWLFIKYGLPVLRNSCKKAPTKEDATAAKPVFPAKASGTGHHATISVHTRPWDEEDSSDI
jgi:hypothetical protein